MNTLKAFRRTFALCAALAGTMMLQPAAAQDRDRDSDDPPSRVARLGYMQGSISFQPAGESEWVEAVRNRPLTTGDKVWADRDSRAELQLGSAVITLNGNTGFSFINLDDRTVQIQLTSGSVNVRVRHLDRDDVFEVDTPNLAFSVYQPGRYRVQAGEDGRYTVVAIREGEGEATGNGQTYTLHAGQRTTFEGTESLHADVESLAAPDEFDNWSYNRDRRFESSRSSQYVSRDVVGSEDLDDNGDWRPHPSYGNVWFPRVAVGWAPYRDGHWAWIDPWGWTWVDEEPWGYAPFHYGRWVSIEGRWGWIPGPVAVRPVYSPALVVFIGGGGGGFRANVGWFPLGPREVYVPSYHVSRGYVDRVNISNTTVNNVQITNVYNTTIIHNNTNITNVTYVNRGVSGAVTAVPQRAFVSAQPVARAAVAVNAGDIASAPMVSRAAVAPSSNSVLGMRANTANRVAAPPAAIANRAVVAKTAAPPPPVPFAARQQQLEAHPGQPIARQEMQRLRPASVPVAQPLVKVAPPGKPATATTGKPMTQPGNANSNQPATQPGNQPGNRANPNIQPQPGNQAQPGDRRGEPVRTDRTPVTQPANPTPPPPPPNRGEQERRLPPTPPPPPPADNRRAEPPARNDRPPVAQPNNRTEPTPPSPPNRGEQERRPPPPPPPDTRRAEPPPQRDTESRPAPPPPHQKTPEEKKRDEEEQRKRDEKKPPS